jgi:signal transduction histidine kinase
MHISAVAPFRSRCFGVAIAAIFFCAPEAWAQQKNVLVLHATRADARIAVLADLQLITMLERGLGQRVNHSSTYLELAKFADAEYRSATTDFLRVKYRDEHFDLVIALHETILNFLATARNELFPETPIVFFTGAPMPLRLANSAGVVAVPDLASTVAFASALQPAIRRVYVVSGTDPADRAFENRARAQLRGFEPRLAITYLSGMRTPDLLTRLSSLPNDSIVYYLLVNRDGGGSSFHPLEYLEDIAPVANVPMYSWVDSAIGKGIVGGSLKSQSKQIEAVAEMAIRVLRGEPADSIPVKSPNLQVNQVDWRQLGRWRISESRLPAGTLVVFKDPSVWERFKIYLVVALVLVLAQTTLVIALLFQRGRRRQAEEQVRRSQAELQTSYDRIETLGGRLLHAQETERARLAGELHDDICQQLALLATDLELMRSASAADRRQLTVQARERTQTVARSVHDLSYRLYPAKLTLIGLVPALQSLQREMERSVIVMNFVHRGVPRTLPDDVTLCVFRVVQEALQNAIKYSGAREVSLSVEGVRDELVVMIVDDGVGFDVGAVWGNGLGLISMKERVSAVNGKFVIHSEPGAGTRLCMAVPLESAARTVAAG